MTPTNLWEDLGSDPKDSIKINNNYKGKDRQSIGSKDRSNNNNKGNARLTTKDKDRDRSNNKDKDKHNICEGSNRCKEIKKESSSNRDNTTHLEWVEVDILDLLITTSLVGSSEWLLIINCYFLIN